MIPTRKRVFFFFKYLIILKSHNSIIEKATINRSLRRNNQIDHQEKGIYSVNKGEIQMHMVKGDMTI